MEKLCIDVRGFSEEKKKRVQDAFFKLGCEWLSSGRQYKFLDSANYGNVRASGQAEGYLMRGSEGSLITEKEKPFEVTYTQLMQKAGLDESDPDEDCLERWLRDGCGRHVVTVESVGVEPTTDTLRETIEGYLWLLDSIRDPEARQLIKQQLTDLQDLEFKIFNGENTK